MTQGGVPYARHTLVVLMDGTPVIDWGDGNFQDILTGRFIHGSEADVGHTLINEELVQLMMLGHVLRFDDAMAYLPPLPEPHRRTIE